eukprot:7390488-Prymnesium_polylepis.1
MMSMVKLMRYDRTGRAKTEYSAIHAPARSSARLERGVRVTGFGNGVGFEHSLDKRTPPPPSGGVW